MDAAASPDYPAEIVTVISNRPKAQGLERAAKAGVSQHIVDHKDFPSREEFDDAVDERLRSAGVDFVCLAGFMRILSDGFVESWRGRLLNIHPTLLPAFKGLNVHDRMIAAGVKIAGCTVHFVTRDMDGGPIIGQAALAVEPSDTAETLAERILAMEHTLYPQCLKLVAENKARLAGAVVRLAPDVCGQGTLHNPA